jgi:hypothetical protein
MTTTTGTVAATASAAAWARDATCLELLVCFFNSFLFFLFYYTNDYFRYPQHIEMAAAAAGDATCLEPLVHFIYLFIYYTKLLLGPLNSGARDARSRLEPLVYLFLFCFIYDILIFLGPLNAMKRRWQRQ